MPGDKSSAHDTEARVRKFAAFRILAIPSLIRTLFPTMNVAKGCRLGILHSQPLRNLQWTIPTTSQFRSLSLVRSICFPISDRILAVILPCQLMHSPLKTISFRDGLNKAIFINIRGELPLPQYIFRYNPSSVTVCARDAQPPRGPDFRRAGSA